MLSLKHFIRYFAIITASLTVHCGIWLLLSKMHTQNIKPQPQLTTVKILVQQAQPIPILISAPKITKLAATKAATKSILRNAKPSIIIAATNQTKAVAQTNTTSSPVQPNSSNIAAEALNTPNNCLSFCNQKLKGLLPNAAAQQAWANSGAPKTPEFSLLSTSEKIERASNLEPLAHTLQKSLVLPISLRQRTGVMESTLTLTSVLSHWTISNVSGDPYLRAILFESVKDNFHTKEFRASLHRLRDSNIKLQYIVENTTRFINAEERWALNLFAENVVFKQTITRPPEFTSLMKAERNPKTNSNIFIFNMLGAAIQVGKAINNSVNYSKPNDLVLLESSPAFSSTGPFAIALVLEAEPTPTL